MTSVLYLPGFPIQDVKDKIYGPPLQFNEVQSLSLALQEMLEMHKNILLWKASDIQNGESELIYNALLDSELTIIGDLNLDGEYVWILSMEKYNNQCLKNSPRNVNYVLCEVPNTQEGCTWTLPEGISLSRISIPNNFTISSDVYVISSFPENASDGVWIPIPPSRLSDLHNTVGQLKSKGLLISGLHVGEMSQVPCQEITQSLRQTLLEERPMGYTTTSGIPELQNLIREDLVTRKNIASDNLTVVCTNGARQALFQSLLHFVGPNCNLKDNTPEVIIPSPCWGAYAEMTHSVGANSLYTHIKPNGDIDIDHLGSLLNNNTRILILCSPHNPTSTLISKKNLQQIAEVLEDFPEVVVISDEVYERLTFPNESHVSPGSITGLANKCITISSFSKSHLMTGLRIGYLAGNSRLVINIIKLQSCICTCASSLSQYAAIAALNMDNSDSSIVDELYSRATQLRDIFQHRMKFIPKGGYYAWIEIDDFLEEGERDIDFCYKLLQRGVAVAAGSYFGMKTGSHQYIRISYGCPSNDFTDAIPKLAKLCIQ
jgi:aspartate/glutamate/aspartate-prephenate aminotransferase